MRDTTSSVPDAASRGRDCAAPSNSSESQNKVTSVSERVWHSCPSCGRSCYKVRIDGIWMCELCFPAWPHLTPVGKAVSEATPARDYLVEQLVITASHLALTRIAFTLPDLPFCQVCSISGINGRPIAHLPSCAVGQVRKAIDDLCVARPLTSWDHGDFASSTTTACEFCGPICYGGAAHNARVEDNARFDDPKPTDPNATVLA